MRSVAASDGHPNAAQPVPKRSHLAPNPNAVISNAATKVSLKALEIPPGTQTVLVVCGCGMPQTDRATDSVTVNDRA